MLRHLYSALFSIILISSATTACTAGQETEVIPTGISIDVEELSFTENAGSQTIKVQSVNKWSISAKPEWLTVESFDSKYALMYEWSVSLSVQPNDGYNREGTITFNAGNQSLSVLVSQRGTKGTYVSVESVSLSPSALTLMEGESYILKNYAISPSNASEKGVTWKSSSPSVATVSESGEVEAIAIGTTTITVTTEDGGKTATCSVTVKAKVIPVQSVSLDRTSITMTEGDAQTLIATVTPENATDKSVTWSSSNTSVASVSSSGVMTAKSAGTATITVNTNDGRKTAACSVIVNGLDNGSVDLGLSVRWATCNLGSSSPSDYGNFYAWGEINPKASNFRPNDYKWFNVCYFKPYSSKDGIDAELMIKIMKYSFPIEKPYPETDSKLGYYMTQFTESDYEDMPSQAPVEYDNIYVLQQEDDAARWELGKGWRIPTDEEWKELIEQCEWIPSTRNGVNGYIVTSKKNGASIFLPKAGFISGDTIIDQGTYGNYWSSSLSDNRPFVAKSISCGQSGILNREGWYRYDGLSIRPVYSE